MKRLLAYITGPWGRDTNENKEMAAEHNRKIFEAGYNPICPMLMLSTFIDSSIPQEHKYSNDISQDYLRRSKILVVWHKD